eukprot:10317096-Alexandrium_andersonii.AAC.1
MVSWSSATERPVGCCCALTAPGLPVMAGTPAAGATDGPRDGWAAVPNLSLIHISEPTRLALI